MSDAKDFFDCTNNKEAKKGFMSVPKSLEEVKKNLKNIINQYSTKKPTSEFFVIDVKGSFAGYVLIDELNKKYFEHKGNLAYAIHPKFRGKSLSVKATKLLLKHAFKKHKLKRIEGWCRTFNKVSARVLEKAGFKLEGVLRKNKFKNGKYLDDMIWAKIK